MVRQNCRAGASACRSHYKFRLPVLRGDRFSLPGASPYGALARPVTPDRKRDKQKIDNYEGRDIGLAADTEAVGMKSFSEHEIDSVPRHQDREKTDDACHDQTELGPPAGEAAVQCQDITEQCDQRPCLFRIPTPESDPGVTRPYASQDCARA